MKKLIPLLLIVIGFSVSAFGSPTDNSDRHAKMQQRMTEELQLSADQQSSFEAIMQAHHEQMRALRDLSRAERKASKENLHQELRSDLSGVLSQEQLTRFDQMHEKRMKHRSKHRKHADKMDQQETL